MPHSKQIFYLKFNFIGIKIIVIQLLLLLSFQLKKGWTNWNGDSISISFGWKYNIQPSEKFVKNVFRPLADSMLVTFRINHPLKRKQSCYKICSQEEQRTNKNGHARTHIWMVRPQFEPCSSTTVKKTQFTIISTFCMLRILGAR